MNKSPKYFNLPCFNISVILVPGMNGSGWGGSISSQLKESDADCSTPDDLRLALEFNAAMDGIESMILAHACAGIDVCSPAYVEGVETAVQSAGEQF